MYGPSFLFPIELFCSDDLFSSLCSLRVGVIDGQNNEVFGGSRAKFSRSERNLVIGNTMPEDLVFETDESCFKAGSQPEASPIC